MPGQTPALTPSPSRRRRAPPIQIRPLVLCPLPLRISMTHVDRVCVVSLLSIVCAAVYVPATAGVAHAQSAEAEALFRDGRALIRRGKLAPGCDKLAASERLETSVGTLLNLGDCREKLGKLASAWAAFRKAEAMARRAGSDDKRQAEAERRARQLEPKLSNLEIRVAQRNDGLVVH